MQRAVWFVISVYASVPVLLYLFPWILGHAIYAHLLRLPFFVDLSRPEAVLNHTSNFYLSTEQGVSVGVWHTLPASQWEEAMGRGPEWYRETLGDGRPVIIYLHGNLGTRAINHRVELVKVLSTAGYHVLSLDYRGYGDSTGEPSEAGLTRDALYLYYWSGNQYGGFESLVWDILERNNIVFANDENLKALTSPVLILHAEDDSIVPYHMGLKLYQISLQAQAKHNTDVQVKMVSYTAKLGFCHNNIYLDPNLPNVVREFLQT